MNEEADQFVGRKTFLQKVIAILNDTSSVNVGKCLVNVVGRSGFGKTAFMVSRDMKTMFYGCWQDFVAGFCSKIIQNYYFHCI